MTRLPVATITPVGTPAGQAPIAPFVGLATLWVQITGTWCNLECRHCINASGPKSPWLKPLDAATIERAIREAEAVSGIETFGMKREQARFLNLPFYQTGKVRKDPIGPEDVHKVLDLLEEQKPELSSSRGTSRTLTEPTVCASRP
ncbi:MAG TPA: hypothetical protein VK746_16645, partial [Candidatus Eisenbacteria bacterium]|nr:hypothetical protein [Candidatus Eisenbacteria bacterium]